jgi:hypothetical protein
VALKSGAAAALGLPSRHSRPAAQSNLPLITKAIPSSGERVPVIGLGTNAYSVNTAEQMAPLPGRAGADGTAWRLGHRHGARIRAIRGRHRRDPPEPGTRKQFFLATKTPIGGNFSDPQAVLDVSFTALRTDVIDLMQIHMMAGLDALMPVFEKAKAAKRIRYIGISTSSDNQYTQLMAAMKTYRWTSCRWTTQSRTVTRLKACWPCARRRKIGVLINVPFGPERGSGRRRSHG